MAGRHILVTDDSGTIRTQVKNILTKAGFNVQTARDGEEALQMVQDDLPMLLVLDVNMPVMDGFEVSLKLRQMGAPFSEIPIIFLTSSGAHVMAILGDDMGGYLRKPVCDDQLLECVRAFAACV